MLRKEKVRKGIYRVVNGGRGGLKRRESKGRGDGSGSKVEFNENSPINKRGILKLGSRT